MSFPFPQIPNDKRSSPETPLKHLISICTLSRSLRSTLLLSLFSIRVFFWPPQLLLLCRAALPTGDSFFHLSLKLLQRKQILLRLSFTLYPVIFLYHPARCAFCLSCVGAGTCRQPCLWIKLGTKWVCSDAGKG